MMENLFKPIQPEWMNHLSMFETLRPSAQFQHSIACVYQFQTLPTANQQTILYGIPDGCIDILFNLSNDAEGCYLVPSPKIRQSFKYPGNNTYLGIRLLPLQTLFKFDVSLVEINQHNQLPLFDIFPTLRTLYEQLLHTTTLEQRLYTIERFLCAGIHFSMAHSNIVNCCIHHTLDSKGNLHVKDLEHLTCYSARYLRKLFQDEIGISPKQLIEMVYFQYTLQEMLSGEFTTNNHLNIHDFYDASHFHKRFKKLTNMTPKQYQKLIIG